MRDGCDGWDDGAKKKRKKKREEKRERKREGEKLFYNSHFALLLFSTIDTVIYRRGE